MRSMGAGGKNRVEANMVVQANHRDWEAPWVFWEDP